LVVAFHLGLSWARGGLVGVDVFFVLSGYLITSLLLAEREQHGRQDLARFWGRRARRLLPALCLLLVVLATVAAVDPRLVSPTALRVDGLATLFYVQNWHLALQSARAQLAQVFSPSPLLQTWSLAIEEQFYLVWPLVVAAVAATARHRNRRSFHRRLAAVAAVGGLASVGTMAALSLAGWAPLPIYYDSAARAFELLIGAGLALAVPAAGRQRRGRSAPPPAGRRRAGSPEQAAARRRAAVGLVGLAAILTAAVAVPGVDASWLYRGGLLGVALAAAALIGALARGPRSRLARALSWRPLVGLGRISYGVYLWHWPVLVLVTTATTGLAGWPLIAVQLGLTVGAATASFFLVERPVYRLQPRRALRQLVAPVAATAAACVVVGALAVPVAPQLPVTALGAASTASSAGGRDQPTVAMPPSTGMTAPVRYAPARDAR
jgi:peptidoglycan/LPS O-acetylase OafA/YrhL